jgi:hypothetical protein
MGHKAWRVVHLAAINLMIKMHTIKNINITKLTNNGDRTNHQLQLIVPIILSVMNISVRYLKNPPPRDKVVFFDIIKRYLTYRLFYTLPY